MIKKAGMKKIIVISVLFLLTAKGQAQKVNFKDIAGNWEVVGEQNASLNIIDSSTIEFTYLGEKKRILNYSIDLSKSPCWLDFSAADSASVFHVKSLMQKVGDDVLKWQLFIDEERSPHFTSNKGEVFYLKKTRPMAASVAAAE
jgi:hypothetical protein